MSDLARTVEALLFLSPDPVSIGDLAEATEATEGQVAEAIELLSEDLGEGKRGIVLRVIGGGFALASDPAAEGAARRLLAKPRTPPLTPAQAVDRILATARPPAGGRDAALGVGVIDPVAALTAEPAVLEVPEVPAQAPTAALAGTDPVGPPAGLPPVDLLGLAVLLGAAAATAAGVGRRPVRG